MHLANGTHDDLRTMSMLDSLHRPERGHSALRQGRASLPGQSYLVTMVTQDRRPLFARFDLARRVAAVLAAQALWRDGRLHAWVLMPDHWHGLLTLGALDSLATAVGRARSVSARMARAQDSRIPQVWARAFHDRALRREEDLRSVARYVVANPLRAGLVGRVGDYPFWDAEWLHR